MTGRSSFAGNTKGLYAGKKPATLEPIVTTTTDEKSMKKKNERRERTFTQIGVSASVRSAMASQMGELLSKIDANQSAEEKLKQVMIGAKQSGMTVEKIFSFFSNDSNSTKDLTPDAFRSALKALSPTVFDLEESEVKEIVVKFDTDGDGLISFAEFKNYCYYNINAVCWRAERLRMEKSGEMKRLAAETAHQIVPEHDDEKVSVSVCVFVCVRARARARARVCVCVCVCVGLMCFILWLVGECDSLIFSLSSRYLLSRLRECIVYGDNTASLQIFYSF